MTKPSAPSVRNDSAGRGDGGAVCLWLRRHGTRRRSTSRKPGERHRSCCIELAMVLAIARIARLRCRHTPSNHGGKLQRVEEADSQAQAPTIEVIGTGRSHQGKQADGQADHERVHHQYLPESIGGRETLGAMSFIPMAAAAVGIISKPDCQAGRPMPIW